MIPEVRACSTLSGHYRTKGHIERTPEPWGSVVGAVGEVAHDGDEGVHDALLCNARPGALASRSTTEAGKWGSLTGSQKECMGGIASDLNADLTSTVRSSRRVAAGLARSVCAPDRLVTSPSHV